jgi:hypothetical protein
MREPLTEPGKLSCEKIWNARPNSFSSAAWRLGCCAMEPRGEMDNGAKTNIIHNFNRYLTFRGVVARENLREMM